MNNVHAMYLYIFKIHMTGSKLKHLGEWIASYSTFNLEGPY